MPIDKLKTKETMKSAIICDCTFSYKDRPIEEIENHRTAGLTYVSITIATDIGSVPSKVFNRIRKELNFYSENQNKFVVVKSVEDILRSKKEKKLSIGFHLQGAAPIGNDLKRVEAYYRMGINCMLLVYNQKNALGTGCLDPQQKHRGLTRFGKSVVHEMNRVGMIVDLAHTGYRATMEAIEISKNPAIISHANVHKLCQHPRNVKDDQIKAIADSDGFVGITGVGAFLGTNERVDAESIFSHIDHVAQLVGSQHVGLGLDFMSSRSCKQAIKKIGGDLKRIAMPEPPWFFFDPQNIPSLIGKMVNAGYSPSDVYNILGGNFIRVAEKSWK